jgi:dCTP deaminase
MPMLDSTAIRAALRNHETGFAVTPLLNEDQIGRASLDLRLGPDMIIMRRETGVLAFDPARAAEMPRSISEYQRDVRRPLGSAFYLHPGDFAIARSLEFVTLPENLAAQASGRSSWGRLGLVIATASLMQPKFHGTITLELANIGTVPLVLYVGVRIAQVSFFPVSSTLEPFQSPIDISASSGQNSRVST